MSYQLATILGNVGKDPEVKYLDTGTCIAKFPVATSERFKNRAGEQQERTEWWNVVAWGKLGEVCEKYIVKGSQVLLTLTKRDQSWDDTEGKRHYKTEFTVTSMKMVGKRPESAEQPAGQQNSSAPVQEDAPFPEQADDYEIPY